MRYVLAVLALLVLLVAVAAGALTRSLERDVASAENAWKTRLGGRSFVEAYPARPANETALRLEETALRIGIDLAPAAAKTRRHVDAETKKRFAAIDTALKDFGRAAQGEDDRGLPEPDPVLAAFLASNRDAAADATRLLLDSPEQHWERDLSQGFATDLPNGLGALQLQRVLLAEGAIAERGGDLRSSARFQEAANRLATATLAEPYLIFQLIGHALIRTELGFLRHSCADATAWLGELKNLELRSGVLRALDLEAYEALQQSRSQDPLAYTDDQGRRESPSGWVAGFVRWGLRDYSVRLQRMNDDLRLVDVARFDPDADTRRRIESLPRWQPIARLLWPAFGDALPRAARTELAIELTLLAREERAKPTPSTWSRRPSAVEGLQWLRRSSQGVVTIEIDHDLTFKSPKDLPLLAVVHPDRCPPLRYD